MQPETTPLPRPAPEPEEPSIPEASRGSMTSPDADDDPSRPWASGPRRGAGADDEAPRPQPSSRSVELRSPNREPVSAAQRPRSYAALLRAAADPGAAQRALHRLPPALRAELWTEGLPAHALDPNRAPPVPSSGPHVIVVGAGLAGLVTAQALEQAGLRATLLEARSRIGGRAWRCAGPAGPLDLGAAWLHDARSNPLTEIARRLGLSLRTDPAPRLLFGTAEAPARAGARLDADSLALASAWARAGRRSDDPASRAPVPAGLGPAAIALAGALSMGAEPHEISTRDYATIRGEEDNLLVEEGLAALTEALSIGLDLRTGQPALEIRRGPGRVAVRTPAGWIEGEALVWTAPPSLAARSALAPHLPAAKREAAASLPMGHLEKVVFALEDAERWPSHARAHAASHPDVELLMRPLGRPIAIGFVGGEAARRRTAAERTALVQATLRDVGAATGHLLAATDWARSTYSEGAYSVARPGHHAARAAWAAPYERLFFAGEACHDRWAQCLPGAYLTGLSAAEQVVAAVGPRRRRRVA